MKTSERITWRNGPDRILWSAALLAVSVHLAVPTRTEAVTEAASGPAVSTAQAGSATQPGSTPQAASTTQGAPTTAGGVRKTAVPVRVDAARVDGAVSGGLRWLAEHQIREGADAGAWPVGTPNYRPAISSLAGLAFLANGYLPGDDSPYGKVVAQSIKYVMRTMASDGYVGQGDRSGMYIHAISSLFALSCLGMQNDEKSEPELAEWCRRSLDVIVNAQQTPKPPNAWGGWRYEPNLPESDVSVTCWQLLVLHTARQAGYEVEPRVFSMAHAYLRRAYVPVKSEQGQPVAGGYLYRPGFTREPSRSSTALVLFIQSLFNVSDEKRARESLVYLRGNPPTWGGPQYGGFFYFASFYMVQGMFQIGGDDWKTYGPQLATVLLDHQTGDGSWPYPPDNAIPEDMSGTGTAYPVALAVLMLSIDKQYLPMYQRQRRFHETGVLASAPEATAPAEEPAKPIEESGSTTKQKPPDELTLPPPPPAETVKPPEQEPNRENVEEPEEPAAGPRRTMY